MEFSKEKIDAMYRNALYELNINIEVLSDLAKTQDSEKAEYLELIIKRNIKAVKMFRNNN